MLHLDQGGKNQLYTWYFGGLLKESPNLDFDVFGLSYYPMWHGTMEGLQYNLNYLATTYNKEVCVVETAYAWTTEDGDGEGNVFISGDEEVGGYPATVEGQLIIFRRNSGSASGRKTDIFTGFHSFVCLRERMLK